MSDETPKRKKPVRERDPLLSDPDIFMYELKQGKTYYFRGVIKTGEEPIERSLKVQFPNRGLARQKKKELLAELGVTDSESDGIRFGDAADLVLADYRHRLETAPQKFKHKVKNTLEQAKNYLEGHLKPRLGDYFVHMIDTGILQQYVKDELTESQLKLGRDRKFSYDRRYYHLVVAKAEEKKKLPGGVKAKFPLPDGEVWVEDEETEVETFTHEQMGLLKANARGNLRGLVIGSGTMGLRPIEVFGAPWKAADFEAQTWTISVEQAKRNKHKSAARKIRMSPAFREYLLEVKQALEKPSRRRYKASPWIFPARGYPDRHIDRYHKQWDRLLEGLGIPNVVPYTLRHTAITEACRQLKEPPKEGERRASVVDLAQYFGTSVEEIERTYLHFTHEDTGHVSTLVDYTPNLSGGAQ